MKNSISKLVSWFCLGLLWWMAGPGELVADPVLVANPVTLSPTDTSRENLDLLIVGEGYLTVQGDHSFGAVYFSNALGGQIFGPHVRMSSLRLAQTTRLVVKPNGGLQISGLLSLEQGSTLEAQPGLTWTGTHWSAMPSSICANDVVVDSTSQPRG